MLWVGPAIIGAIGLDIIIGNPLARATVCDATQNCLLAWVGALSGWAALLGAVWTIGVMRQQLAEQRRQTDHMMGNGSPEMFIEPHVSLVDMEAFAEVSITIINRNRRPLRIHEIKFESAAGIDIGVKESTVGEANHPQILSTWSPFRYVHRTIPGKDEGQPAPTCVIICHVFKEGSLVTLPREPEYWSNTPLKVMVDCFQKDIRDNAMQLVAHGEIHT